MGASLVALAFGTLSLVLFLYFPASAFAQSEPLSLSEMNKLRRDAAKAYKADPENYELMWLYGNATAQYGMASQSARKLRDALKIFDDLEEKIPSNRVLALSVYDANASLVALGEKKRMKELRSAFEDLDAEGKRNANPPSYVLFVSRLRNPRDFGDHRLGARQKDELYFNLIVSAVDEAPTHIQSRLVLSDLYGYLGFPNTALAVAQNTVSMAPENVSALSKLALRNMEIVLAAECSIEEGVNLARAIEATRQLIKHDFNNIDGHRILRNSYVIAGQPLLAEMEARRVIQIEGKSNIEDEIELLKILNRLGKREEVDALLSKREVAKSKQSEFQAQLAHFWRGDFPAAIEMIESEPKDSIYDYLRLGLAREQTGEAGALKQSAELALAEQEVSDWEINLASLAADSLDFKDLPLADLSPCNKVEAMFYHAVKLKFAGREQEALTEFQNVVDTGLEEYFEYQMSEYFLNVE